MTPDSPTAEIAGKHCLIPHYRPNPRRTSLQSNEGPSADCRMDADFRSNPSRPILVVRVFPSPGEARVVVTCVGSRCSRCFQLPFLIPADQSISKPISIHGTWKVPVRSEPIATMADLHSAGHLSVELTHTYLRPKKRTLLHSTVCESPEPNGVLRQRWRARSVPRRHVALQQQRLRQR